MIVNSGAGVETRIGLLDQEPPFSLTRSVQEAVEDAVSPTRNVLSQVDRLGALGGAASGARVSVRQDGQNL